MLILLVSYCSAPSIQAARPCRSPIKQDDDDLAPSPLTLAFLKSETTPNTVITPTAEKRRRWHRHLHLALIRRVGPHAQARPQAHKTLSLLLGPLWTTLSADPRRMQIAACPPLEECAVWWVRFIQPWRDGDPQYMDGSTLLLLRLHLRLHLLPLPPEPMPRS